MLRQLEAPGLVLAWCTTRCTVWRELELRGRRRELEPLTQTHHRRRIGHSRLARVGQPEGGSKQVMGKGQEVAPEEARVEQVSESRKTQAHGCKAVFSVSVRNTLVTPVTLRRVKG